jgi:hypothetical protein
MVDSIFSNNSKDSILDLIKVEHMQELYSATQDYVYKDVEPWECPPYEPLDVFVLTLIALRQVRQYKLHGCKKIKAEHISDIINEMSKTWGKMQACSYEVRRAKEEDWYDDRFIEFYVYEASVMLILLLHLNGDIRTTKQVNEMFASLGYHNAKTFAWNNKEKLKQCLSYLLSPSSYIEYVPMDIIKVLDNEYYKKKYRDFKASKSLVSWYDIINQIKSSDQHLIIKDFLDRAIKATITDIYDRDVRDNTIAHLDKVVATASKPLQQPSIVNNFNAPISNFAQEQHVDNLTTK